MARAKKQYRESSSGVDARVKGFASENELIDPPIGVEFSSESEWTLWRQYTLVRDGSDWRDTDLLMLAKIVGYELEIRELNDRIQAREAETDPDTGDGRLAVKERNVRDQTFKQLIQMTRTLNLNQLASDPRVVNKAGQGKRIKKVTTAEVSLLAGPNGWEK